MLSQNRKEAFAGAKELFDQLPVVLEEAIYSWDDWATWRKITKLFLELETMGKAQDLQHLAKLGINLHLVEETMTRQLRDELLLRKDLSAALAKEKPLGLLRLLKAYRRAKARDYGAVLRLLDEPLADEEYQMAADKLCEMANTQIYADYANESPQEMAYRINYIWMSLQYQDNPDEAWKRILALYRKYPLDYEVIRFLNMFHMLRRGFGCYNVRYDTGANLLYDRVDPKNFIYRRSDRATIAPTK